LDDLVKEIQSEGWAVELSDVADALESVEAEALSIYGRLSFDYQNSLKMFGKPVIPWLAIEGKISAWWFTYPSQRNPLGSGALLMITHIVFLRKLIEDIRPSTLVLCTSSTAFERSARRFLRTPSIIGIKCSPHSVILNDVTFFEVFRRFLKCFLMDLSGALQWKHIGRGRVHQPLKAASSIESELGTSSKRILETISVKEGERCLIFSSFPFAWSNGKFDRFLGRGLSMLPSRDPAYQFITTWKGQLNWLSWKKYRAAVNFTKSEGEGRARVLESVASPLLALRAYWGLISFRTLLLVVTAIFSRSGEKLLQDLKPIFINELLASLYVTPSCVYYFLLGKRFGASYRPNHLLAYFFEFSQQRAFLAGVRAGHPEVRIYGMQHCLFNRNNTTIYHLPEEYNSERCHGFPLPQPDVYFVDGKFAKEYLEAGGASADRIEVVGSARFEDAIPVWKELREERTRSTVAEDSGRRILVALSLPDWQKVLSWLDSWVGGREFLCITIKPHPVTLQDMEPFGDFIRELKALERLMNEEKLRVVDKALDRLFVSHDLLITGESSAAVEAFAAGLKILSVPFGDQVNLNPLLHASLGDLVEGVAGAP
jgi:hypothetical protein